MGVLGGDGWSVAQWVPLELLLLLVLVFLWYSGDLPFGIVGEFVVFVAEHDEVVQIGGAACGPVDDVVGLALDRR